MTDKERQRLRNEASELQERYQLALTGGDRVEMEDIRARHEEIKRAFDPKGLLNPGTKLARYPARSPGATPGTTS